MNEAQRDDLYMDRAMEFFRRYPTIAAEMAIEKLEIYTRVCGRYGLILLLLAAVGVLAMARSGRGWLLALSVAEYSAAFVLVVA
jgi:hypothetical protein